VSSDGLIASHLTALTLALATGQALSINFLVLRYELFRSNSGLSCLPMALWPGSWVHDKNTV